MVVVALIFIFPLGIDPFLWVAFFAPSFASDEGFDPSVISMPCLARCAEADLLLRAQFFIHAMFHAMFTLRGCCWRVESLAVES